MSDPLAKESDQTIARVMQARRFAKILTPLAEFFGVDRPTEDLATTCIAFAKAVADQAEIAVLNDEHTLADVIGRMDARFKVSGLDHKNVGAVLRHVRAEVAEIERAFADFGVSDDDATRAHALTEIGDAMFLLARLAMRLGARPLEPLMLAVRKTGARLRAFDSLPSGGEVQSRWHMAKLIAGVK